MSKQVDSDEDTEEDGEDTEEDGEVAEENGEVAEEGWDSVMCTLIDGSW